MKWTFLITVLAGLQACSKESSLQELDLRSKSSAAAAGQDNLQVERLNILGSAFTSKVRPEWQWVSGLENSDQAVFRISLDDVDLKAKGVVTKATSFVPKEDLSEGEHVFYLQEKVSSSSWSAIKTFVTVVDFSPPPSPQFTSSSTQPKGQSVKWEWTGENDSESYLLKLGDDQFSEGAITTNQNFFIVSDPGPADELTLYLVAKDLAGNISPVASQKIKLGTTP